MKKRGPVKGFTVLEMVMAALVVGFALSIVMFGNRIFNWVDRQLVFASVQRDAQIALFNITKDVRNSQKIIALSSTTLRLNAYNFTLGFDTAKTNFFNNIGTITYQYVENSSGGYLSRHQVFNGVVHQKKWLQNVLLTVSPTDYLFGPFPETATEPYEAVNIVFRCGRGYFEDAVRVYEAEAMVKSRD